ncbi:MAG TPA: hypothetical protein VN953_10845 [Gemmatimonadales bacterium]|nr:hypothetical protein [Gemmatimonadales bacterium]
MAGSISRIRPPLRCVVGLRFSTRECRAIARLARRANVPLASLLRQVVLDALQLELAPREAHREREVVVA